MPNKNSNTKRPGERNPLRTGIFGLTIVVCVVLATFGYTKLPFWPQGRHYDAYFTNAAGIKAGNDVQIYGYKVGNVASVELVTGTAKVGFSVDRKIRIGDQSLAAIKTDTVLGKRALEVKPAGSGLVTSIPLGRTTTPYSLNDAVQDLGHNADAIDKGKFVEALQVLTNALHDATPQLHDALDGLTVLSRSVNARDEQVGQLLSHAHQVSGVLAKRSGQLNQLIDDGNRLFAELSARRQALGVLISGINDVARQISGFVADNRRQFGPALAKLNMVLDNLNEHRDYLDEALKRLPPFATALGESVGSAPAFVANIYGLPPANVSGMLLDAVFQPGKLPASISDFLRGLIAERMIVKPKSP
ncbi:MCE family protein [Mycobacterium sp. E2479]|uniref:MCE family protein n=1 Tax=Mycobacterium sp. E2479 TaxID=1834134 RepID=UPI000800DC26|nr:MCE family protein [Mycobacterium sp. E2479]OBH49262.1 mammalian cell entry protein [Mycobacterium sp. E2479]